MQVSTYLLFVIAQTLVRAVGVARVPTATIGGMTPATRATPDTFGEYFDRLVSAAGYGNVTALARASGVSHANLGKWINNTATPSVDALRRVAPLLGVRLGDLMIRAGLATREELGTVGAPPPPGPPLTRVERTIRSRMMGNHTERYKRAFHASLERAVDDFDEVVADLAAAPAEPRMRRRAGVS